jgi:hypothetical protein
MTERPSIESSGVVESNGVETRIKWASAFIGAGLLVQVASLFPIHPLAFVSFLILGCPLMAVGVVIYLVSLVSHRKP